ncbi:DUF4062 domain-containing protein [Antrihabitans cavernicola]|uniref:DUF4062 domain-containing protein n=1 Tax=Antrihabitans cavernicola TaxID=2495913 RepID=UPI00165905F5|nr:DUF4062 domain-containing protein [Spelaeibacter cavernicola]
MDDKRYQVFVSSTYTDLTDERAAVIQAILRMDHLPAGMEMFPSADEGQWALIEQVIDQSDYYIVVVAGRYGSVIDAEGISFTEKEYDYAVKSKIPVLGFVHKDPGSIPANKTDMDPAVQELLQKFREKVQSKPVTFFESPAELGGLVVTSLLQAIKKKPGMGWIRGDQAMTVEQQREILALREQVAALREEKVAAESALVEDVSKLAQGDETVTLWVEVESPSYNQPSVIEFVETTWDGVFRDVAPELVDEGAEVDARQRLASHLVINARDEAMERMKRVPRGQAKVHDDDWDLVKTQFRALGLIDNGLKKRPVNDSNKYVRLTEKGDRHLTALIAVPRGIDPNSIVVPSVLADN